jgi:hypothetical protein
VNVCALILRLLLKLGVGLDSADELFSRSGQGNVLDSEVDSLLDVSVLDLLIDDDTDCALGDIVDNTGLSVVDLGKGSASCDKERNLSNHLVWHALLNSSVGLDINDVSDSIPH